MELFSALDRVFNGVVGRKLLKDVWSSGSDPPRQRRKR